MENQNLEIAKQAAAKKAVEYIENGMRVGLGTGTSAKYAIEFIAEKVAKGLEIKAIPTSVDTQKLANSLGIKTQNDFLEIDLTIDGADKVDPFGNLIKGGGGALTREKIVAKHTIKEIIIIDETKLVENFNNCWLPVEILNFGFEATLEEIKKLFSKVELRNDFQKPFLSDNGNYIVDCFLNNLADTFSLEANLKGITGVIETGLFLKIADVLIVGRENGQVDVKTF